ncbi:MAG: hypothetical protein DRN92_06580 [Thermoproteota archaeon]|nr:MAG: hypothetical protein DRN92_06580 [Candidatus Korarchaeota archaeon]
MFFTFFGLNDEAHFPLQRELITLSLKTGQILTRLIEYLLEFQFLNILMSLEPVVVLILLLRYLDL